MYAHSFIPTLAFLRKRKRDGGGGGKTGTEIERQKRKQTDRQNFSQGKSYFVPSMVTEVSHVTTILQAPKHSRLLSREVV